MQQVIIGASAAGLTAAKLIRQQRPEDEITVVSIDTQTYSRCKLHYFLSGQRTATEINFVAADFFEKNRIHWKKGVRADRLEPQENRVHLSNKTQLAYDQLLLASGANYVVPPLPNFRTANNIYGLRSLSDAQRIAAVARHGKQCVIIGSGLVGLDAASALCARGVRCAILELADRISPLQLDTTAAAAYQRLFEQAGCRFYLAQKAIGSQTDAQGNITAVLLENNTTISCDFVLTAAGVRPAIDFLEGSGIETGRAVMVDQFLRTNLENIWAAGDVTGITGVWPSAVQQGEIAAKNMCGERVPYTDTQGLKNAMNFYGLSTLSIGVNDQQPTDQVVVEHTGNSYKRAILRDGVLTHVILQGDLSDALFWQELVKNRVAVGGLKKPLFALSRADF